MAIRNLKIVFTALISLLCLFYATQNLANLEACYQAFAYVLGGLDHEVYPDLIVPVVHGPLLVWLAMIVVIALEAIAGLLAAIGAWDLWRARKAGPVEFNGAKTHALVGMGLGIVIWLGLFGAFGGGLFAMWQTEVGRGSLESAFQFFGSCALVFLIVANPDT